MDNITMDDLPLVERDRVLAIYAACKRIFRELYDFGKIARCLRQRATIMRIYSAVP